MKSPSQHRIVQIEITNACHKACSNCTRFVGHHDKPFFMDFDTFKKAVDSLKDHPGMIGVMGGEPTLHPQFDQLVAYYATQIGEPGCSCKGREPISDFAAFIADQANDTTKKRGLWSALGRGYYKNFELIQEVFDHQAINDHHNPGLHQGLLISRKDIGVSDEDWPAMRDNCWVQNLWSSSITPKGAFFCEVAGALDMLFDGPGGWPIEPGWWERTPEQFGDQLNWCEMCGACLQTPRVKANLEIDTVSPTLLEKLKAVNSPKVKRGRYELFDPATYNPADYPDEPTVEWYLPNGDISLRVLDTNRSVRPWRVDGVIVSVHTGDELARTLDGNRGHFDHAIVATVASDDRSQTVAAERGVRAIALDDAAGAVDKGRLINEAMAAIEPRDWVCIVDADVALDAAFGPRIRGWVLNPGVLYRYEQRGGEQAAKPTDNPLAEVVTMPEHHGYRSATGCFELLNVMARSLRPANGRCYPEGAADPLEADARFIAQWPAEKRIDLARFPSGDCEDQKRTEHGRLIARHAMSAWTTITALHPRVALYGAGRHTRWLLELIGRNNLTPPVVLLDDRPSFTEQYGMPIRRPEQVTGDEFDCMVISTDPGPLTDQIAARAAEVFGDDRPCVRLYSHFPPGRFRKVTDLGEPPVGKRSITAA